MGLNAGGGILLYIVHSKTRSNDPQGEVDILGQRPAGVSPRHHQADLVIQSNPKSLYKLIVAADDEVAGNDKLLHICLQVLSSLEKYFLYFFNIFTFNKYVCPIGLKGIPNIGPMLIKANFLFISGCFIQLRLGQRMTKVDRIIQKKCIRLIRVTQVIQ